MKAYILFLGAVCISAVAGAQEALWSGAGEIVSPQVNDDSSVTFRYYGPANRIVAVNGDFIEGGTGKMEKDGNGVWTYTTSSLSPELYLYTFTVDSVQVLDPQNIFVNRDITSFTNQVLVKGKGSEAYDFNPDIPHGTVSHPWYRSGSLDMSRRLTVYIPAGYETGMRSYPVLYLLHGMGGDENAWLENGRLAQIMDYLIAEGLAEPMIVVAPNGNPRMNITPAERSLMSHSPKMGEYRVVDGSFESSFPEIVEFVEKNYRAIPDKEHRAIAGLSMGGFHSLTVSKEFPDLFDYVGLFSAATHRILGEDAFRRPETPGIYRDYEEKIIRQFSKNPALYWIGIGKDDFLYDSNTEFRRMLSENDLPYEYYESEGGHTWRNWRRYMQIFVPKLFKK